jgi:hypothetical protein
VSGKVMEIQDLQHLESIVDKAGSSLLVVFFYTRSCGVCKELLRDFTSLCEEVRDSRTIDSEADNTANQQAHSTRCFGAHHTCCPAQQCAPAVFSCAAACVLLQAKSQKIRAVFARHNLIDDFDSWWVPGLGCAQTPEYVCLSRTPAAQQVEAQRTLRAVRVPCMVAACAGAAALTSGLPCCCCLLCVCAGLTYLCGTGSGWCPPSTFMTRGQW